MDNNDFVKEYNALVERVLLLTEKAVCDGLLSIEEMIDEEKFIKRDIFEYGLTLVLDGCGCEFIDKLLTNIVELETDENKKLFKKIQKEAVLEIQMGTNPKTILLILSSYVNIDVENTMRRYKELYKKEIDKEVELYKKEMEMPFIKRMLKKIKKTFKK
jgi:flagellar motor component MotA